MSVTAATKPLSAAGLLINGLADVQIAVMEGDTEYLREFLSSPIIDYVSDLMAGIREYLAEREATDDR